MNNRLFLKVIIIGDSSVGKTAFLNRFVNDNYSENYLVTIGASVLSKTITFGDRVVELQLWDTAGQEKFQSLGGSFFRGADACILAFDLTNKSSFENLGVWKSDYLLQVDYNYRDELPFVIIGTKCEMYQKCVISRDEIQEWCDENGISFEVCFFYSFHSNYIEVSAKDNININEAIERVLALGCKRSFCQL